MLSLKSDVNLILRLGLRSYGLSRLQGVQGALLTTEVKDVEVSRHWLVLGHLMTSQWWVVVAMKKLRRLFLVLCGCQVRLRSFAQAL